MNAVRIKLSLSVCSSVCTGKTQESVYEEGLLIVYKPHLAKKQTLPKTEHVLHFPCGSVFFPATPSYVPSILIMGT